MAAKAGALKQPFHSGCRGSNTWHCSRSVHVDGVEHCRDGKGGEHPDRCATRARRRRVAERPARTTPWPMPSRSCVRDQHVVSAARCCARGSAHREDWRRRAHTGSAPSAAPPRSRRSLAQCTLSRIHLPGCLTSAHPTGDCAARGAAARVRVDCLHRRHGTGTAQAHESSHRPVGRLG